MKVLIGCEESQIVCKAFRRLGHEAFSCDIIPCSGGHEEWHYLDDVMNVIKYNWDLIILHPPCTYLCVSGNRWYGKGKRDYYKRLQALIWTNNLFKIATERCDKVAMENPVGVLTSIKSLPKPHYVQPWQFGHPETKKTGFWTNGLPDLNPTKIVDGRNQRVWKLPPSEDRSKIRSKTYKGIADAMALQWGK